MSRPMTNEITRLSKQNESSVATMPKASEGRACLNREWIAYLHLAFKHKVRENKPARTILLRSDHRGPLRVQRPFYPEDNTTCHMYLLHPPGGLVIGDSLELKVTADVLSAVLLTTPSAGKVYGAKGANAVQQQTIDITVENDACVEWLPQETIVFDSAQARLKTRIELKGDNAQFFGWDIVRLGRAASGETFTSGSCLQKLEIWKDNLPLFIERNDIQAGSTIQTEAWGLQGRNSYGTLIATVSVGRDYIDRLIETLEQQYNGESLGKCDSGLWAITQKKEVFIARYLGDSISDCRAGFEYLWSQLRPTFNDKPAVVPRIWNT